MKLFRSGSSARDATLFQDQHTPSGSGQEASGSEPARAGTDHDCIVGVRHQAPALGSRVRKSPTQCCKLTMSFWVATLSIVFCSMRILAVRPPWLN